MGHGRGRCPGARRPEADAQPDFDRLRELGLFNQIIQEQLQAIGINCEIGRWSGTPTSTSGRIRAVGTPPTPARHAGGRDRGNRGRWPPDDYWTITQIDDATDPDLVAVRERLQEIWDEWQ